MAEERGQRDASASKGIRDLVSHIGLKQVVWVDDIFALGVEDVVALCAQDKGACEALLELAGDSPDDAGDDDNGRAYRDIWGGLPDDAKRRFIDDHRGALIQADKDLNVCEGVSGALEGVKWHRLSLSDWKAEKSKLVPQSDCPGTLVLFDRDFSHEGNSGGNAGISLLSDFLGNSQADNCWCGLFTQTVEPDDLASEQRDLAGQYGIPQDRFVVIPKAYLSDQRNLPRFALQLKLCFLAPLVEHVRKYYVECLGEATRATQAFVEKKLDLVTFHQAVFNSSHRESAWELDTLTRLAMLEMERRIRNSTCASKSMEAVQEARRVSRVEIGWKAEDFQMPDVRRLETEEWYDGSEYINALHLPLDIGDVFEVTKGNGETDDYVLVAQPCDLVVRDHGKRNYEDRLMVTLCKIDRDERNAEGEGQSSHRMPLPNYPDEDASGRWHVNLLHRRLVRPCLLDLCVMDDEGRVRYSAADRSKLPALTQGWERKYGELSGLGDKMLREYSDLTGKSVQGSAIIKVLSRPLSPDGLLKITVESDGKAFTVNCRRLRRLRRPYSLFLLARLSQMMAREALPHDLIRDDDLF